jgi:hypothetical protein
MTTDRTMRRRDVRFLSILVAVGGLLTLAIGPAMARNDLHTLVGGARHDGVALHWAFLARQQAAVDAEIAEDTDELDEATDDQGEVDETDDQTDVDEDAQGADEQDDSADQDDQGEQPKATKVHSTHVDENDGDEADEHDGDEADEHDGEHDGTSGEHDGGGDGSHDGGGDGEHDD